MLVVLPLLPEIVIFVTSILAQVMGCQPGGETGCAIGPSSAGAIIRKALRAGSLVGSRFGDGLAAVWLALSYLFITLGWTRLSSRLLLAFGASLFCAFVPYFGPMLSIEYLANPKCYPNEGGVGPCIIYGGNIGSVAHDTVRLGWRIIDGAPIALGMLAIYAIIAAGLYLARRKRVAPSTE